MSDEDVPLGASARGAQRASLNLVLAGPMGSGKSTVARRLAEALDRPLLDMDTELERRFGRSIAQVFAEDGEAVFRRAEAELCRDLATPQGRVVACGGGAVVDPANQAALSAGGILILLTATPAALFTRLQAAGEVQARPLLRGPDPEGALAALLSTRARAYHAIPYQLDTTGQTPDEVARAALLLYNQAVQEQQTARAESPALRASGERGQG
jgi:shikimate kinase